MLAQESGYTVRLIAKAEAGQSLAVQTLADLAQALSTKTQLVNVSDLICDPMALAMKYVESLYIHQRQLVPHISYFLDDEIIFNIHGNPERIPFAGIHHGQMGVHKMIQSFFDVVEVPLNHDHRPHYHYVTNGMDVTIWGQSWIHPIGSPLETPMPISNLLRFRGGKLYYFEDNYDTQLAERLLNHHSVEL